MQKQSKIFLLFCLCLMFLPNLVNAETYDAYFVESNEYNDVINQNDNKTTVGQVKRYAFNADINFVKYNNESIFDVLHYTTQSGNLSNIDISIKENNFNSCLVKNLEITTSETSFVNFYPNDRELTNSTDVYITFIFSMSNINTLSCRFSLTSGIVNIFVGFEGYNSTHFQFSNYNSVSLTYPNIYIPFFSDSIYYIRYSYQYLSDNLTMNVIDLVNDLETEYITSFISETDFISDNFRMYYRLTSNRTYKIYAIDSNILLVENTNLVGIYSANSDTSYTDNRILEMYDVIDESYDLADYGVINEYFPNFQSYYNQSTYFDVEPWNNDYLNPISTYTIDYRFDASKKRFREIGAWECQQKDASELSKIVFKNETVLTDSDSFSQLIVFSIENIECYPIIFNFLINEDNYGFTLEYYDKILYLFKTSYVDGVYDAHILLEQLNIASYCSYQNEFLFFISGYQLGLNFYFSYTLMINQIETWFELDVLEDCVNTFTGINDSVMLITDLDDNILRLLHPFNTSLLNRPFDFILKCFFVSDEYKLSITDFNEVWKSIDYRCFSEGYEFELEFEGFNQFLNHNITDYLLYYLVVNISVESTEIMFDLVIHSIFALSEFYNESNYIVNYTVDELTQDLTIFFLYITLFTDYINNSIDISINFTEYWLINWEIVEVGWFSVLMKGIAPLSIIVVFAVAGYHFFKIKGVICAIALSFIVLYFMSMINLVSAIMLVVVMIVMLIYNIKRKGANIDV